MNRLLNDAVWMKALLHLLTFRINVVCNILSFFKSTFEHPLVQSPEYVLVDGLHTYMTKAFEPFKTYIGLLAEGSLDEFLESTNPEKKVDIPGIYLSTDPQLLIHQLGQRADR